MTLGKIALSGTVMIGSIALSFIMDGMVKAVHHNCEKHHGGAEGCVRHKGEEAALRQEKIDDRHSEAEHKGEHINEERGMAKGPARTALEAKHRQQEAEEHAQNDAHRAKEDRDHEDRDAENEKVEREMRTALRDMDDYAKESGHDKGVIENMAQIDDEAVV